MRHTTSQVPVQSQKVGVRQKWAMKKAAKQQQKPAWKQSAPATTGHVGVRQKWAMKKAAKQQPVPKPSMFQKFKMMISTSIK